MKVNTKFRLPKMTKKTVKVRVLADSTEQRDSIASIVRELVEVDSSILRIKPDTNSTPFENVIYVKPNNFDDSAYPQEFRNVVIPLRKFIFEAHEGRL